MREVIIALDVENIDQLRAFMAHFPEESLYIKVGMELYYSEGPRVLKEIKDAGHKIFLDLKLHDIPNTVGRAMKQIAKYDVDMVNVHATGGSKMMEAAIRGLEEGTPEGKQRPLCIAVSQLTSTSEEQMQNELLIPKKLEDSVLHFAKLAKASGLDGVVCSALEVPKIQEVVGKDFVTVTPGIRLASSSADDQVRVVTPDKARQLGSTYIVVGRNITQSEDPRASYYEVKKLWEEQ